MASIVAEFGHKHDETDNATIFDPKTKEVLRRALKAMWDAEKQLRAVSPRAALAPEIRRWMPSRSCSRPNACTCTAPPSCRRLSRKKSA